jgi:pimeloyl-ACP methyl ester carboxylesterase
MPESYEIDVGGRAIRGEYWRVEGGLPTIALHGYLDNANSFSVLAEQLTGHDVFAMDFAGHGFSDYRGVSEVYHGLADVRDVLAVADHFGWPSFHIIGHSMGAEIGSQIAGLFPDRVRSLVCIDGFCSTNSEAMTLEHLAQSVTSSLKRRSALKVFPSLAAMTERLAEVTGQEWDSASLIVARGHRIVADGFTWRSDPRFKGAGPFELTAPQLRELIQRIQAPTLVILADLTNTWLQRSMDVLISMESTSILLTYLPAHHHLHMQGQSKEVGALIRRFVDGEDLSGLAVTPADYRRLTGALTAAE